VSATSVGAAEQVERLVEGCDHVETRAELQQRIAAGERLTVKLGIDPTGSFLHLGHAVVLHKLQQFVEFGHRVILLIGDFTARIGDPTGRNDSRPRLSDEEIAANMRDYREQAGTVLDLERVEIAYNSTWLAPLTMPELIALMAQTTVAQMLARNDFSLRYAAGTPIALHEFLYPIAQAYDSVAMRAGVELGGSDQLFNLLLGREYQERAGQPRQICLTTPILEGTDGVVRMGKSRGNYIGLTEPAHEQFGKLMRMPDEIVPRYALLAAFRPEREAEALAAGLRDGRLHPMNEKKALAEEIVARYHGAAAARAARERFEATVQRGEIPAREEIPPTPMGDFKTLADALIAAGFAQSKRDAERLVSQGGVRLDDAVVKDARQPWPADGDVVLAAGKHRFRRFVRNSETNTVTSDAVAAERRTAETIEEQP
jgi:tyrosyl-tRNA synthetase